VAFEIAADGGLYSRKEGPFANLREEPKALELVLDRVFELSEAQFDPGLLQSLVQFGKAIGRGDIHAGDWFCRNDQPLHRRGRLRGRLQNTLLEYASNSIVLGNTSISAIYAHVSTMTAISDRRRK
jgi:hypothetical protein